MFRVFVDTSAWYAYIRLDDPHHSRVRQALEAWDGKLVTSNFVFDELVTLTKARLGSKAAERAGNILLDSSVVDLVRVQGDDEEKGWKLFCVQRDKTYSYTDCTSFVLMRRLDLEKAIATDRHFLQAGFQVEPSC